ncbi:ead/Ea22-like family protein [Enterobacter cloacae]
MSNIDKRALREAAVRAGGVKWQYMRATQHSKAYITDDKGSTVVNCTDGDVPAKCAGFLESSNPAAVLALLDELEESERLRLMFQEVNCELCQKLEAAENQAKQQGNIAVALLDEVTKLRRNADDKAPELRSQLEEAEKRIAELSSAVIAPGIMRCAGCGFVLTKNSINMAAGTIAAGNSKTEPCPNGCGPLWPVTWKEQAIEMRDSSEQWFEELLEARQRIAELEARTVTLPAQKYCPGEYAGSVLWGETEVWNQAISECAKAIRAAGIGKGE